VTIIALRRHCNARHYAAIPCLAVTSQYPQCDTFVRQYTTKRNITIPTRCKTFHSLTEPLPSKAEQRHTVALQLYYISLSKISQGNEDRLGFSCDSLLFIYIDILAGNGVNTRFLLRWIIVVGVWLLPAVRIRSCGYYANAMF